MTTEVCCSDNDSNMLFYQATLYLCSLLDDTKSIQLPVTFFLGCVASQQEHAAVLRPEFANRACVPMGTWAAKWQKQHRRQTVRHWPGIQKQINEITLTSENICRGSAHQESGSLE